MTDPQVPVKPCVAGQTDGEIRPTEPGVSCIRAPRMQIEVLISVQGIISPKYPVSGGPPSWGQHGVQHWVMLIAAGRELCLACLACGLQHALPAEMSLLTSPRQCMSQLLYPGSQRSPVCSSTLDITRCKNACTPFQALHSTHPLARAWRRMQCLTGGFLVPCHDLDCHRLFSTSQPVRLAVMPISQ